MDFSNLEALLSGDGDFDRMLSVMTAKLVVESANGGAAVDPELVKRCQLILDAESMNDQVVSILGTIKMMLRDFDPHNHNGPDKNLKIFHAVFSIMSPAVANLGQRMKDFREEYQDIIDTHSGESDD